MVDDLGSWFAGVVDYFQSEGNDRLFLSLVSAAAGDPGVAEHFNARFGGGHTIDARLQQGVDAGELQRGVPTERVADALIGAMVFRLLARSRMEASFATDMVHTVLSPFTIDKQLDRS